jgi:hypothetical protein
MNYAFHPEAEREFIETAARTDSGSGAVYLLDVFRHPPANTHVKAIAAKLKVADRP